MAQKYVGAVEPFNQFVKNYVRNNDMSSINATRISDHRRGYVQQTEGHCNTTINYFDEKFDGGTPAV